LVRRFADQERRAALVWRFGVDSRSGASGTTRTRKEARVTIDWNAVREFKESEEYFRLGILGRERLLYGRFPELKARHLAQSARHLETVVGGSPSTPDPDQEVEK
jgi:hypothetical protein